MANNTIPVSYDPVVQLLSEAVDGARGHGAEVGLKQNDEAALRGVLEDLVGTRGGREGGRPAEPGFKAQWNQARAHKKAMTAALNEARQRGKALAMACVSTLKPRLGHQWNSTWQTAGFTGGSLQIPPNPQTVLHGLRAYYAEHPDHEVPNLTAVISCGAAGCAAAADAIAAA